MDDLTTTQGIVALGAAALALIAFIWAAVLAVKLRRLRSAQRAVLGADGERDLVEQATGLEAAFVHLRDWVEESSRRVEQRMGTAEERIDGCVAHLSLVRYDAYNEMSGQQSSSVALLDTHRSGVVVSSIAHRDQARVYVKQVHEGHSELELSPEEQEAIETAMGARAGA
jgi:Protein of unknown function (DUF4446)